MSTSPKYFYTKCLSMRSLGTLFGQYQRALACTPFSTSGTIIFEAQKLLYITTNFPVENMGLHIWSMSTAVFPSSKRSFGTRCDGLSFSLKICDLHKIEIIPQQIVWRSFPKGWGFLPTHTNPGGGLFYVSIILFLIKLIQEGLNSSVMFLFHASSICLIWNILSSYYTSLFVYLMEARI